MQEHAGKGYLIRNLRTQFKRLSILFAFSVLKASYTILFNEITGSSSTTVRLSFLRLLIMFAKLPSSFNDGPESFFLECDKDVSNIQKLQAPGLL